MQVTLMNSTHRPIELIYKAYRVCYSKGKVSDITIPYKPTDGSIYTEGPDVQKMIDFIIPLMANGHTSPLEHVSFTFGIDGVSRSLLAQITRHRTGKFNVQSQRYVDGNNFEFVTPQSVDPKLQFEVVMKDHVEYMTYDDMTELILNMYDAMRYEHIPKEDARFILPNAATCNMIVTFDLHNFRNFYGLRHCKHAQWEIKDLADKMMKLVKSEVPFADYKAERCNRICNECFKEESNE